MDKMILFGIEPLNKTMSLIKFQFVQLIIKNYQGEYNIHLYYVQNDGKLVGVTGTKTDVHFVVKPAIPDKGVYTFTGRASIKAEPKTSSPELAYYDAGNTVNYDKVLFAYGHYWISYLSFSGNRRYISIV